MLQLFMRSRRLALLAAGLLGLSSLSAGEPIARSTPSRTVKLSPGRLREMQIELAWMADPATYRCPLKVRVAGTKVEVSGTVPNEKVKNRVLQIAYDIASAPVHDCMTVGTTDGLAYSPSASEQVTRDVSRALVEILGKTGKYVDVIVKGDGRVTLKGAIVSTEEKHAVGVRLRFVAGCACVSYQLDTSPRHREIPTETPVSVPTPMTPAEEGANQITTPKVAPSTTIPVVSPYQSKPAPVMPKVTARPASGIQRVSMTTPDGNTPIATSTMTRTVAASTTASPYQNSGAGLTRTKITRTPYGSSTSTIISKSNHSTASRTTPESSYPKAEKLQSIDDLPVDREPSVKETVALAAKPEKISKPELSPPTMKPFVAEKVIPSIEAIPLPQAKPIPVVKESGASKSMTHPVTKEEVASNPKALPLVEEPVSSKPKSMPEQTTNNSVSTNPFASVKAHRTAPRGAATESSRTISVASTIKEPLLLPTKMPAPKNVVEAPPQLTQVVSKARTFTTPTSATLKPASHLPAYPVAEPLTLPKGVESSRPFAVASTVKEPVIEKVVETPTQLIQVATKVEKPASPTMASLKPASHLPAYPVAEPLALPKGVESSRPFAVASTVKEPVIETVESKIEEAVIVSEPPPVSASRGFLSRLVHRERPMVVANSNSAQTISDPLSIPDKPYVTTGMIVLREENAPVEPVKEKRGKATAASLSMELVRGKVIRTGGLAVLDAEVSEKPNGGMSVKVRVKDAASVEHVVSRIRQIDEMKAANVELSFHVGR